jgi:hypothetical protein
VRVTRRGVATARFVLSCAHKGTMARFALRPTQRTLVRALAEALFAHDAGPSAAQLDAVVEGVEAHLVPVSRPQRALLLLALELVRWIPVLLLVAPGRFEDLGLAARVRVLERMDRSRVVFLLMPLVAFKTLLAMIFFEQPAELDAMGYPGDERKRWLRLAA